MIRRTLVVVAALGAPTFGQFATVTVDVKDAAADARARWRFRRSPATRTAGVPTSGMTRRDALARAGREDGRWTLVDPDGGVLVAGMTTLNRAAYALRDQPAAASSSDQGRS